ncbi:MAG: hypothetical protein ABIF09_01520 [Gemmatimonadota bacterium]
MECADLLLPNPTLNILRTVFGPAFLCLLLGCGPEMVSEHTTTVRDPAGITIVENQESVLQSGGGWSIAPDPRVVIGSIDGPEVDWLLRVQGALCLGDGRIAVANDGSQELRIYGTDGSHLRSVGGNGEGPGQFKSVMLIGLFADTLVVLDPVLRRVSLIHPDGGFVRSFTPVESATSLPMGGWLFQTGMVLIRNLALGDLSPLEGKPGRMPEPYKVFDMSGALLMDFGVFPGPEQVMATIQTEQGPAPVRSPVPFGKTPQIAVAGGRVYFGAQDAFEIKVFGDNGSLQKIVRLDRPAVPVTDADLAAFIHELGIEDEALVRRRIEGLPRVAYKPYHGSVFADSEGYLFVEDFRSPGMEASAMNVFDPEGRLVGRFEVPAGVEVQEIGEDHLLALFRDEMGVEHLQIFELARPKPGSAGRP